ncbi:MAG: hypothetical protein KC931_18605 [Candidatus Omnitrophica bacterium]|nr:hypothetical protein [Candidatus Omnitrophota bacterium]MCA9449137.1 hypothetical protein [Candidatus Omnitrophota bacterium]
MKRSMLKFFSFLMFSSLVLVTAQTALAEESDVENHPLFQSDTVWGTVMNEDTPVLENHASTNFGALEIISNNGLDSLKENAKREFSLGTVSDAVGGAITKVIEAPVGLMEKAVGTISGLNPLNLLHNDKKTQSETLDNSILTKELEINSKYTNRSYEEWFANETAESLVAQKPAPREKQRMKIQILIQDFISSKDK